MAHTEIIQSADWESGADVTLPLFTYVVLKAKADNLYRNYYFIKSFRYKPRREARDPVEFRYTLTTLKITLNFISELSMEKLKLGTSEESSLFRNEMRQIAVQTDPIDASKPQVQQYSGPLDAAYLGTHAEDMQQLLSEYTTLRDFYKCRIALSP